MEIQKEIVGKYNLENGAIVSIPAGGAQDFAQMRATQLSALSSMMQVEAFEHFSSEIKSNIHWLASTLSDEIQALIPIVISDVKR